MSEAQMRRISYLRSIVKDRDAEIERLRADIAYADKHAEKVEGLLWGTAKEREKLRAALEKLSCKCPSNCDWEKHGDICPSWVARAALEEK